MSVGQWKGRRGADFGYRLLWSFGPRNISRPSSDGTIAPHNSWKRKKPDVLQDSGRDGVAPTLGIDFAGVSPSEHFSSEQRWNDCSTQFVEEEEAGRASMKYLMIFLQVSDAGSIALPTELGMKARRNDFWRRTIGSTRSPYRKLRGSRGRILLSSFSLDLFLRMF
uniref:Uncharacterized protein n=1 Tax=Ascaris lumbricoides TaxID=6252 RepID=A0A0M3IU52_ASCLU